MKCQKSQLFLVLCNQNNSVSGCWVHLKAMVDEREIKHFFLQKHLVFLSLTRTVYLVKYKLFCLIIKYISHLYFYVNIMYTV